MSLALCPCDAKVSTNFLAWVDFPLLSSPSNTTKSPLLLILTSASLNSCTKVKISLILRRKHGSSVFWILFYFMMLHKEQEACIQLPNVFEINNSILYELTWQRGSSG